LPGDLTQAISPNTGRPTEVGLQTGELRIGHPRSIYGKLI
jgi:hypothetical protein